MKIMKKVHQNQIALIGLRNHQSTAGDSFLQERDLLDFLCTYLGVKNDAALARRLLVSAPIISKIRHNTLPVSAALLIRMHEVSGLSIYHLRACMGDHRSHFGILE